jgi:hypothetical protein
MPKGIIRIEEQFEIISVHISTLDSMSGIGGTYVMPAESTL